MYDTWTLDNLKGVGMKQQWSIPRQGLELH